ncbi:Flp pilus secretin RcpA [Syntrophotalea carbinolica DSM 2380]|uniref:Flp pilus secretin RcpA n=1 Tax=Syntrophotalea carbinolica (strain DSM 2380 / NBRC 103641 / GraBd1) TaxID=338963 RepID=Q3A3R7_SYNC1|nr:type II and III secretion system protein family protein [Syntrophotalea carbinolica]ABA88990.1 Flp pilus secretin RcpA [Syntrophotalea carbinolica DSM 2380]
MTTRRAILPAICFLGLFCLALFTGTAAADDIEHLTLDVNIGGSELVEIREPSQRMKILISNGDIIGARPLRPNLINVYNLGKKIGFSRVTVWDDAARQVRAIIDVSVNLDLTPLKQKIGELYPHENIKVYASETGVVLSGTVSSPEVVEQVIRLTETFLPKKAEASTSGKGTGKSGSGITNLLSVGGVQQVMLEVKFAEVTRSSGRDWQAALGFNGLGDNSGLVAGVGGISGDISGGDFTGKLGSVLLNFADFASNPANIFVQMGDFTSALRFLEDEGLARILAEPRLVTMSGQEASFLAGGEFPIPVPDEDGITIEFREFGVSLRFTPVVMSDGKISLRVAPSVSDIASTSSIPSSITGTTYNVPNLTTRKLETTVQLYDGQTLALAGLLQDTLRESVSKIPGLGDLPILGALFRSTSYTQEKTDLLIAVTPHLVKPSKEGTLSFPGEYMRPPNRLEFYLEGRLEGRRFPNDPSALSQHSFAAPPQMNETAGGLEGEFGHEPVTAQ